MQHERLCGMNFNTECTCEEEPNSNKYKLRNLLCGDGVITAYEDNCMSLSCHGEAKIKDGVISDFSFKGIPRLFGDGWASFFKNMKFGDIVLRKEIDTILKYNKTYNIVCIGKPDT